MNKKLYTINQDIFTPALALKENAVNFFHFRHLELQDIYIQERDLTEAWSKLAKERGLNPATIGANPHFRFVGIAQSAPEAKSESRVCEAAT